MQNFPEATHKIGKSDITVTPIAMGCWPISGMTSVDVHHDESLQTLKAAFESGINFFDTAYCYGANGESERLIAEALCSDTRDSQRDQIVIATKCGIHWDQDLNRVSDASPKTIHREIDESLTRLNTDRVELLYLHSPDPEVPVAESAGALLEVMQSGKARSIGVSNFKVEQLDEFQSVCPISAVQPPYNMLQRQIESSILPWCESTHASAMIFWPLMKGLLAGKLRRDHEFDPKDSRRNYPMFNGDEWQRNQDFVDVLREIAADAGRTVSQVVINWTINQPGISVALCGAKRDWQIRETAGAMGWSLSDEQNNSIEQALAERGVPVVRRSV